MENVQLHTAQAIGASTMCDMRRNANTLARPEQARFTADLELQLALKDVANLFLVVRVHRRYRVWPKCHLIDEQVHSDDGPELQTGQHLERSDIRVDVVP